MSLVIIPDTNISNAQNFYGLTSLPDWKIGAVRGKNLHFFDTRISKLTTHTVEESRFSQKQVYLNKSLCNAASCFNIIRSRDDFMTDSLFFNYVMPKEGDDMPIPSA